MTDKKTKKEETPVDPSKLHVKPTQEELEKGSKKLLEESEKLEKNPPPEDDQEGLEPEEDPEPEPEEDPEEEEEEDPEPEKGEDPEPEEKDPEPEEEEESEEDPEPEKPKPSKESKPGDPDYKKKFKSSSAEAQILYAKNKKMADAMTEEIKDPTEEEIIEEYPDFEVMSEAEQKRAKKSIINDRRMELVAQVSKDFKDVEAWNDKVDEFLIDPDTTTKTPELDGREEEFKTFVSKETRIGVDFETLVLAFKQTIEDIKPAKNKGAMFEKGTGGDRIKPKPVSNKISVEESGKLRVSNYRLYLKYLKADKIDNTAI